jgi:hypothetical protein
MLGFNCMNIEQILQKEIDESKGPLTDLSMIPYTDAIAQKGSN